MQPPVSRKEGARKERSFRVSLSLSLSLARAARPAVLCVPLIPASSPIEGFANRDTGLSRVRARALLLLSRSAQQQQPAAAAVSVLLSQGEIARPQLFPCLPTPHNNAACMLLQRSYGDFAPQRSSQNRQPAHQRPRRKAGSKECAVRAPSTGLDVRNCAAAPTSCQRRCCKFHCVGFQMRY